MKIKISNLSHTLDRVLKKPGKERETALNPARPEQEFAASAAS